MIKNRALLGLSCVALAIGFLWPIPRNASAQEIVATTSEIPVFEITENKISNESENGTASETTKTSEDSDITKTTSQNSAKIKNNIAAFANTGRNSADENEGSVRIVTGDSQININVNNIVNTSVSLTACCYSPTPSPVTLLTPTPDPSNRNDNDPGENDAIILHAGDEVEAGGPGVLGLSDTSSLIEKVKNNTLLIIGINTITIGLIFLFESYISHKNKIRRIILR